MLERHVSTVKKNCHFDYSCLLSSYTWIMNTLHTWTKLDGMSLWRELVKNAEAH